ncbi:MULTISPECIES: DmsE family decaheme c-type cytochrome [unclassified Colwellia]|uniref:DmsE family decaheme c-type cytochrome n=1 Tax=unclassified Colwellia TaxID=196834 RepID=UPI0015F68A35|nr:MULTISPECIES: DmsE family decaheme c-type cytochrome [unclassified Colwellia]MBA6379858.1 DmsE family decaheme c-type cytochrome [Colwellia sp. BRX10-7]MBA6386572.1 DmsE family decaheme c-type cytochrome [Colwellia sp. BRX10-2]MBA6401682.1 DmsE family decaheme c-type cytochrome [Colwellia sp. BRX10-5]MBA6406273.1 DmsE family decaheme c-type cytochrome [Colwellia sp. BRX10-1]
MRDILKTFFSVLLFIPLMSSTTFAENKPNSPEKNKAEKTVTSAQPLTADQLDILLVKKFKQGKYSKKGADSCLKCHDGDSDSNAMGIFNNVHGRQDVKNSPFSQLQCESCHGPAGKHTARVKKGKLREPVITFGIHSLVDADKQNSVCMSCHEDRQRISWQGSSHQSEQVPCASCHQVHEGQDPILFKQQQNKLCGSCHKEQLHAINKRSSHPLKWGQMACSDCHNPHGSFSEHELQRPSINQTCYQCHSEKRGPLLWEHAPVAEDCSVCHDSHGSINANMLKQRTPQICQDCHTPTDHPSTAIAGSQFVENTQSTFALGQNCMNCHSLIHGSNHPAGHTFQR